jgi:hypothetical protein
MANTRPGDKAKADAVRSERAAARLVWKASPLASRVLSKPVVSIEGLRPHRLCKKGAQLIKHFSPGLVSFGHSLR